MEGEPHTYRKHLTRQLPLAGPPIKGNGLVGIEFTAPWGSYHSHAMLQHSTHHLGCNATHSRVLPSTRGSWSSNPIPVLTFHLLHHHVFLV